jgi:gamma-glutamyltranspeptidase
LLLDLLVAQQLNAQETFDGSTTSSRTFRPVVRGTRYAVSSMKQEATRAAARILESGGNAFDAIVAGQAVLALVNPESNGLGADAVILVYHAGEKQVYSINADGTAPKLAARFPTVTDYFPRRCQALSMRGMYCSIAGVR